MARNLRNKFNIFISVLAVAILGAMVTLQASAPPAAAVMPRYQSAHKVRKNILQIKVSTGITLNQNGTFIGEPADQVQRLNDILAGAKRIKSASLKQGRASSIIQSKLDSSLNNYYRVVFDNNTDVSVIAQQLQQLSIVENAYNEPTPAPSPTTDYGYLQNYLTAAPQGVDEQYAETFPGGTGTNAKIYDLEYSWNTAHEDLSKSRAALIPNGTPVDPFNDNNHGTAVLGTMLADNNSYGVKGVASSANLRLVNVNNAERGYDLVNAIYTASASAQAGDVVLIEQQTWGPTSDTYDFVPVEWIPAVYDAIKTLTNNGVIVIESGGNGNQNLNNTSYYGSTFPMGKPDSGAIIVGAGDNCSSTAHLSRLSFSNYGSRINLQGPGGCVATTGYGDLYSGAGVNAYYTNYFNGTSSAAALVAAVVADFSSSYKTLNAVALNPAQVRSSLVQTGSPQNTLSGSSTGNIGPLPNLAKALLLTDKAAPSKPINLKVTQNSYRQAVLSWPPSTDNVRTDRYRIYRNGVPYNTIKGTTLTDTAVRRGYSYNYYIIALDASNNASPASAKVYITIR